MKKKEHSTTPPPMEKAMGLTDLSDRRADPLGSYTGQPVERLEKPVQDVDDL